MIHLRFLFLSLAISFSLNTHAEDVNFCNDSSVNQQWDNLLEKYGTDPDWVSIYRLRKRLYRGIEQGEISLDTATERFEDERVKMIERMKKKIEQEYGEQVGTA